MIKKYNQYIKENWNDDDDLEEENEEDYEDFITNDEFRQFLIDNNCYDQYIKNCYNSLLRINDFDITLNFNKIEKRNREGYISNAFVWEYSPEGENYWENLDDLWNEKL